MWSQVEVSFALLLVPAIGAEPKAIAAMYYSLRSSNAQIDLVVSAVRATLKPTKKMLFEAILRRFKEYKRTRDIFCHWLWGFSPEIPNAVLFVDPKSTIRRSAEITDMHQRLPIEVFMRAAPTATALVDLVYTDSDLDEVLQQTQNMQKWLSLFRFMDVDPARSETIAQQLSSEPELRPVLAELGRKNGL